MPRIRIARATYDRIAARAVGRFAPDFPAFLPDGSVEVRVGEDTLFRLRRVGAEKGITGSDDAVISAALDAVEAKAR